MISYFQDYVTIGAVLGFGLFLVVLLLGVASVLRPNKPYEEKLQTYECGVDPVGTGWSQTYVRYYICLLYTSPSPRDSMTSRMPSSA